LALVTFSALHVPHAAAGDGDEGSFHPWGESIVASAGYCASEIIGAGTPRISMAAAGNILGPVTPVTPKTLAELKATGLTAGTGNKL
jgi:hypothetical protein